MNMIKDFLREEDGATAIEYALIVGLIAIAIIAALAALGGQIGSFFETLGDKVSEIGDKVGEVEIEQ